MEAGTAAPEPTEGRSDRVGARLGFVCLIVDDMSRSLTFYEHLGFEFPPEAHMDLHVEETLPGGLRIMWDRAETARRYAPGYQPAAHGRAVLGFQLPSPDHVDALFDKLTNLGYRGDGTPWDAPWAYRYAIVYDPDGNLIELYSPRR